MRVFSVYLLKLESNKFYSGSTLTDKIQERYEAHCSGSGAKWTKQFKPLRILRTWNNLTSQEAFALEHKVCLDTILEQGCVDSCRGGTWNFGFTGNFWWCPRSIRHLVPRAVAEQTPI